ncbi:MAG: ERF family protein [Thermoplasmatales archaeon]|nr:MAG: ERF family protein [Thermoplasmatales archaeon]
MSTEVDKSLNLHQRLHAIMKDIKYIQKDLDVNITANKTYKGISHDAVTKEIRSALVNHRVLAIPSVIDTKEVDYTTKDKYGNEKLSTRTKVVIEVNFINIDNPEDYLKVCAFGYGLDSQDKGPGKAVSYAVKYALLKTFSLETGDDPENDIDDIQLSEAIKKVQDFFGTPDLIEAMKKTTKLEERAKLIKIAKEEQPEIIATLVKMSKEMEK